MSRSNLSVLPAGGQHQPAPRATFTSDDLDALDAMYDDVPCRGCSSAIRVLKGDDRLCMACRADEPARRTPRLPYSDRILIELVAGCDDPADPLQLGDHRELVLDTVTRELLERSKSGPTVVEVDRGFTVPGIVMIEADPHRSRDEARELCERVCASPADYMAVLLHFGVPGVTDLRTPPRGPNGRLGLRKSPRDGRGERSLSVRLTDPRAAEALLSRLIPAAVCMTVDYHHGYFRPSAVSGSEPRARAEWSVSMTCPMLTFADRHYTLSVWRPTLFRAIRQALREVAAAKPRRVKPRATRNARLPLKSDTSPQALRVAC
jgi:hypothetical protein